MDNSKEWTFMVTYHKIFYAIAYRHCSEAERLEKDFWERHRDMETTLEGLDFRVKNDLIKLMEGGCIIHQLVQIMVKLLIFLLLQKTFGEQNLEVHMMYLWELLVLLQKHLE